MNAPCSVPELCALLPLQTRNRSLHTSRCYGDSDSISPQTPTPYSGSTRSTALVFFMAYREYRKARPTPAAGRVAAGAPAPGGPENAECPPICGKTAVGGHSLPSSRCRMKSFLVCLGVSTQAALLMPSVASAPAVGAAAVALLYCLFCTASRMLFASFLASRGLMRRPFMPA